jgi:hypothetical protein
VLHIIGGEITECLLERRREFGDHRGRNAKEQVGRSPIEKYTAGILAERPLDRLHRFPLHRKGMTLPCLESNKWMARFADEDEVIAASAPVFAIVASAERAGSSGSNSPIA